MEKSRRFQIFYRIVFVIFLSSAAALADRVTERRRGELFYGQMKEAQEREGKEEPEESAVAGGRSLMQTGQQEGMDMWLRIEGTPVDYPVMRGEDNQYYLDHLPDGSKNALGSLFMDCCCDEESLHWIIYGHNGSGGKMFGSLKWYESQEYFAEHSALTITLSGEPYTCPIFSVRTVTADSDAYTLDFENKEALMDYAVQAAAQSRYPISADLDRAERVLTLSTCTGWGNRRLIVQAAVPLEPSEQINADKFDN